MLIALNLEMPHGEDTPSASESQRATIRSPLTFSLRMRAVWRYYVFRRRVIRQKNGADTLYALHTSRSSGDLLLTNEKLPRVASRRREVQIPRL
jgi:hypothetical protein